LPIEISVPAGSVADRFVPTWFRPISGRYPYPTHLHVLLRFRFRYRLHRRLQQSLKLQRSLSSTLRARIPVGYSRQVHSLPSLLRTGNYQLSGRVSEMVGCFVGIHEWTRVCSRSGSGKVPHSPFSVQPIQTCSLPQCSGHHRFHLHPERISCRYHTLLLSLLRKRDRAPPLVAISGHQTWEDSVELELDLPFSPRPSFFFRKHWCAGRSGLFDSCSLGSDGPGG
jgi:hypothetical protein